MNFASIITVGILPAAHIVRNTTTLNRLVPLSSRARANGNAAYTGPTATEPSRADKANPATPDFCPRYFSTIDRGIHTSRSPMRKKMGGSIKAISLRYSQLAAPATRP